MKIAPLVVLAAVCAAHPAAAQESPYSTRGLGLSLSYNQSAVDGGGRGWNLGGAGLAASYGLGDRLSLFTRYDYGYRSAHLDAGARYTFRGPAQALRPYVELAATRVGSREGSIFQDVRQSGFGVTAGAGVEYFLGRSVSLDLGVLHSEGRYTSTVVEGTRLDGTGRFQSSRLNAGLRWRP